MKVTSLSSQVRNPDRVNVSIDGKYRFSLDVSQITDLNVRVGRELGNDEVAELEIESQFGKLYARALEYCLMRPHSVREVRDYLRRKTIATRYKNRSGELRERLGYSPALVPRVLEKLQHKHYVDDEQFARWWFENRNVGKGTSLRKLKVELRSKGVETDIVERMIAENLRDDATELQKLIAKKRSRYADDQKLAQYLLRQGFRYDDIRLAIGLVD
ncbi:MAG: RecX family transcriptional regulator [Candidatus Saccharimonas aalborgensis]